MDNITRFAALDAKSRALMGKLLDDEDYKNLLSKKSVPEIAAYLKQYTRYGSILQDFNENEIHRGKLETLLKKNHMNSIEKLVHYFQDNYREFYETIIIRYEIEDLKVIARAIKTKRDLLSLKDTLIYIGRYSNIKIDELLASKSINDFINNLRNTIYYKYISTLDENKKGFNFFILEMTLDLAYFDIYSKKIKLLNSRDYSKIKYLQGFNIDLLNIQWIYRGLKFYNLPPEELFNYTILNGLVFSRSDIKNFCYSKSIDAFQEEILKTKYGFLFDRENTKDIFMERRILRYQYFNLKSMKRKAKMDISLPIVYILFSEIEVRDIISIIEIIRYGIIEEEAKKFLIRKL